MISDDDVPLSMTSPSKTYLGHRAISEDAIVCRDRHDGAWQATRGMELGDKDNRSEERTASGWTYDDISEKAGMHIDVVFSWQCDFNMMMV